MRDWLFISGNLALDFCNSLRDRRLSCPRETLLTCSDLCNWFAAAGLVSADCSEGLVQADCSEGLATADLSALTVTASDLDRARQLRDALHLLATAHHEPSGANQKRPTASALQAAASTVNACATAAPRSELTVRRRMVTAAYANTSSTEPLLGRVAASFIELVADDILPRVKECSSPVCGLLFIDDSRGGRRRWCSMQRCGNRAKVRRFAARNS